jgi:hypothetical protein
MAAPSESVPQNIAEVLKKAQVQRDWPADISMLLNGRWYYLDEPHEMSDI